MLKAGSFGGTEPRSRSRRADRRQAARELRRPDAGSESVQLRCLCFAILEACGRSPKEIVKAGSIGVDGCLKQLKLPGSTAVLRLTEMSAHNPLNFLHQLVITERPTPTRSSPS